LEEEEGRRRKELRRILIQLSWVKAGISRGKEAVTDGR